MGLGPTAVIGYMNEDGNWTPVTSEKGLPVTGGSGGGAVASVNGQTGEVELTGADIQVTADNYLGDEQEWVLPLDNFASIISQAVGKTLTEDEILNHIATVDGRVDGVDQLLQSVSSQAQSNTDEIDTLLSTVADLEARLEALENPEEG